MAARPSSQEGARGSRPSSQGDQSRDGRDGEAALAAFEVNARHAAMEFDSGDLDRDRVLEFHEFSKLVREREMAIHTEEELWKRFTDLDTDGSGTVDVPEFIKFALRDALARAAGKVADLLAYWDTDGDGQIDAAEFRKAVLALGFDARDEEVDAIFEELDANHSGTLELRELKQKLFERAPAPIPGQAPQAPSKTHELRPVGWQDGARAVESVAADIARVGHATNAQGIAKQLRQALARSSARLLDLFRAWDENNDGLISKKEFRQAVAALGYDVPKAEVESLFETFDKDMNGNVDYLEMGRALRRTRAPSTETVSSELTPSALHSLQQQQGGIANSVRNAQANVLRGTVLRADGDLVAQLSAALAAKWAKVSDLFHEWDTDRSGTVSRAEVHRALQHLGLSASVDVRAVDVFYDTLDVDGDGELSLKELAAVVRPAASHRDAERGDPRQRTIVPPPAFEGKRLMTPHTRERVAAQEARERQRLTVQSQQEAESQVADSGDKGFGFARWPPNTAGSDDTDRPLTGGSYRFERPVSTPRQALRPGAKPTKLTDAEWFEANKADAPKPSPRAQKLAARASGRPQGRSGRAGGGGGGGGGQHRAGWGAPSGQSAAGAGGRCGGQATVSVADAAPLGRPRWQPAVRQPHSEGSC
jgi:Ca2+-binding EF-hand superfamily protein